MQQLQLPSPEHLPPSLVVSLASASPLPAKPLLVQPTARSCPASPSSSPSPSVLISPIIKRESAPEDEDDVAKDLSMRTLNSAAAAAVTIRRTASQHHHHHHHQRRPSPSPSPSNKRSKKSSSSSTLKISLAPPGASTADNSDSRWQCRHCLIVFPNQTLYFLHRGFHGDTSDPWRCSGCGAVCSDMYDFNAHLVSFPHT